MAVVYDDETKAAALALLQQGSSIRSVARQFGVTPGTVRNWRDKSGLVARADPQKRRDLGELVARYLAAGLETLEAQARLFGDPAWVQKQPAGELAVLHGVLADKLVRVLAAIEPVEGDDGVGGTASA